MQNPLRDWSVDPSAIAMVGTDLRRPECVLAERSGDLWVADLRGGFVHIAPDGSERVITPRGGGGPFAPENPNIDGKQGFSMPNGLCFDRNGDIVIANFGTNVIERMTRAGDWSLILDRLDGKGLGKTNFPAFDSQGRLWFTVTASQESWTAGRTRDDRDGYVAVIEHGVPRIVARGFCGTNEIRFDDDSGFLYVAETGGDHMTRLRLHADGSLTDRAIYGPPSLGGGPDGFAFDVHGNLWTTLIIANRLVAITPEGDLLDLWDGRGADGALLVERMASITFGGPDLRTVYIGSLDGTRLPSFRAPLQGRPLQHWNVE